MAAVTDQDIISRFGALSIAAPAVITHAAVKGGAEWRAELDKLGKTGAALTKTVSLTTLAHKNRQDPQNVDSSCKCSSAVKGPKREMPQPLTRAAPLQAQDRQDC
jgi:hypothetical protein